MTFQQKLVMAGDVGGSHLLMHMVPIAPYLVSHRPCSSEGTALSGCISLKQTASQGSGPAGISITCWGIPDWLQEG